MKSRPARKRDNQPGESQGIKPYAAPALRKLTREEALLELRAKGVPGDPDAEQLLSMILELQKKAK